MSQTTPTPVPNHRMIITDGTIEQLNHYPHRKAKNWVATVQQDLQAQGGLHRDFWKRNGPTATVPDTLGPGMYIEMAGDYYTKPGTPEYHRIYVRVIEITEKHIEVVEVKRKDISQWPHEVEVLASTPNTEDLFQMTWKDARAEVGQILFRALCLIDAWHLDHKPTSGQLPPGVLRELEGNATRLVHWAALEFPTQ